MRESPGRPKKSPRIEAVPATLQEAATYFAGPNIIDGRVRHAVILEIFTTEGVGTEVVRSTAAKRRNVRRIRKA